MDRDSSGKSAMEPVVYSLQVVSERVLVSRMDMTEHKLQGHVDAARRVAARREEAAPTSVD